MATLEEKIYEQALASSALTERVGAELAKQAAAVERAGEITPTVIDALVDNDWITERERAKVASMLVDHVKTLEFVAELASRRPATKSAMGVALADANSAENSRPMGLYTGGKTTAKAPSDIAYERLLNGFAQR